VIITSLTGPKPAHIVIKSSPRFPECAAERSNSTKFAMTRIDFVDWTFQQAPATVRMSILLLRKSRQAIRTSKFDLRAPIAPIECVRYQTAPSPAKIYQRKARREIESRHFSGLFAILGIVGINSFPIFVHAQASAGGEFRLSQSVHWGSAVLPTGEYLYSLSPEAG